MKVSVIVPTFHRPELLKRCVKALINQTLDRTQYEIVIADDGAEEDSEATNPIRNWIEYISQSIKDSGPRIVYVPVLGKKHGPAVARNLGWKSSKGNIIAFTDDDTIPDQDWLKEGIIAFHPQVLAVTGKVIVPLIERPTDYERTESRLASSEFITANCFCRREVLQITGGFDERFRMAWREDSDLHFKVIKEGVRKGIESKKGIQHQASAIVVHPIRPAPWGVSVKLQKKSMYNALLYKKHPELYRQKIQAVPPLRYYALVLLAGVILMACYFSSRTWLSLAFSLWFMLTAELTVRRLWGNSISPSHILEMIVTSAVIPYLSIYWRLRGALQFKVFFF